ncbi:MAG: ABC transporter ATP-binding protein [Betaproteobacteria bacterium]|jgi:iron(III) transport system ATP-binding protein|nr:ABC transporter ATP-binding protein [Betaproteobacteria bacterium]NDD22796.1 ABC transporter ATP-binding protein [Betaproteobacteria bacterium]NDE23922.1 ABC transporter ATP-binding protein [Betaproteobacteria bacterium]
MKKVSVQCRNIRLAYGNTEVLKNVNLEIQAGEFFALLGPSGSGKSTLLRLIAGFNKHQSGALLVDGHDIGQQEPWDRNIGMVFQSYALWPHLSVWDNVAFGLVERKVDKATLQSKVAAALELVGLSAFGQRKPNQLSGGQQQRVALARTIVIEPQVLLLDEPLSNLDKTLRVQMRQELLALQRRLGITTIFVTHDQEEAMTTADRMAVLDQGVVQQVGTPTELYDEPINAFVANFVGTMNMLEAKVRSHHADHLVLDVMGVGELRLPVSAQVSNLHKKDQRVQMSFRPHAVSVSTAPSVSTDSVICIQGTVQGREFMGESTRYRVQVGSQTLSVDQPHYAGVPKLSTGATLNLNVSPTQIRLFAV